MDPDRLQSLAVFTGLDAAVLTELARVVEERSYADGERVFSEGDPGDMLFGVIDGVVRIQKQVGDDPRGAKTLSLLTRGELFGEMSVIDSKPRSASAVATGPTRLLALSRSAFEELLEHNQQSVVRILFSLMRAMNERIRRLNSSVIAYDETGRAIGTCNQLQPLLEQVLHQLIPALGAEFGLVFLNSEFRRELDCTCAIGLSPGDIPAESPGSISLVGQVLAEGTGVVVVNRSLDTRWTRVAPRSWEPTSLVLVPIPLGAGLLGLLVLGHSSPGRFDLNHLNLAEGIARQTAQAILNLRHRDEEQSRARLERRFVKF